MSERDAFERILASLHEAMLDDAHWIAASGLIDEACRTEGSVLGVGDDSARIEGTLFANFCYRGQRRQDWEREYLRDYYAVDVRLPRMRQLSEGRIVHATDLFSEQELQTSPVYNEGMAKARCQNSLYVRLTGSDHSQIFWMIADPVGASDWSPDQVNLITRLLPHLRQFVRVRHALAGAGALGTSPGKLLGNRRAGIIQLDWHGRIAEANDRARDLLRRGDRLSYRNGALCTPLLAENTKLQKLLGRALPRYGDRGVSGSMVITRLDRARPAVLHAIPVEDAEMSFRSPRVAALLLIIEPKRPLRLEPDLVAAAFGLTPAESVVAALLAEGRTIRDIVRATGRAESTVRWHKKNVFSKAGVSRQADLVRLVLSVADIPWARG